jgi:radical SAM superfamily enzyme YgiQ (UPF0313 family)
LIRPNVVIFPQSLSFYGPVPPVGLAYVAAVLRDAGHDVDVIDSVGEAMESFEDFDSPVGRLRRIGLSPDEVVQRIHPDTQVLGVTNMFLHEWPLIRDIIEKAKAEYPNLTVMAGGDNATAYWPWMFEQSDALDYCVLGEGEATALELVNRVGAGLPMDGLQGLAAREPLDGHGACDTGLSIRSRKLSEIPRPAWDLFPIDEYLAYGDFWGVHRGRSMPMLATRGCPYKCTFCSSPQMWTTKYVVRDPEDVADEIADYVERYGVQNVNFSDLTAITRRKWTLEFADALEARDLGISWQLPTGTRAEALDAEVLQRLWDTGCRNIKYAPESGSERMLEIYDKRVKLQNILDSLKAAEKVGIVTGVNIILGHPKEQWGDVWKSFTFLLKCAWAGCNDACVMIFGPYPGSEDWKALVDEGVVVVDDDYHYVALSRGSTQAVSYNPRMSARQLRWTQMSMMIVFYAVSSVLHPTRLWAYVKSLFTGKETTAVDQLIRIKRKGFKRLTPRRTDPVDGTLRTPPPPAPRRTEPDAEPEPALGPAA